MMEWKYTNKEAAYEKSSDRKEKTQVVPDDKTIIKYCQPKVGVCRRIDRMSVTGTDLIVYRFLSTNKKCHTERVSKKASSA